MGRFARIFFLIIPSFLLFGCGSVSGTISLNGETEYEGVKSGLFAMKEESSLDESTICVSVTGCVSSPGIYIMPEGSRVYEAVNAAGGVKEDGDANALNMASPLSDGQKITIPSKQPESVPAKAQETGDPRINLNTATLSELMTLSGIGKSKAESILSYRETAGCFQAIEEIMNVSGIKEGTFEKIKDDIVVY